LNASVKELIITDTPLNYKGSIRQAFPDLVCFCAEGAFDEQTDTTLPAVYDLMFLSDAIEELILYRPEARPAVQTGPVLDTVSMERFLKSILFRAAFLYPGLISYFGNRTIQKNCTLDRKIKVGGNLSKLIVRGISVWMTADKPICIQEDNSLVHIDFTKSHLPDTVPVFVGLKRLQYVSLDSTGIRKLPISLLQYLPSLKVLKLSRNDIGDFMEHVDGDFFGLCPTLEDVQLHSCNITSIPTSIFSRSVNLQRLDISNNYLHTFDLNIQNCTRLTVMNFSSNNIENIAEKRIHQLTQLALRVSNNLLIDLSHNMLHCLCNSTYFIKWLQRSHADTNINFHDLVSYTCLNPNGSFVRVSDVTVSELEQQCSAIQTLVNGSDCPCDKSQRSRLQQIRVHLDGLFCRNDEGAFVPMTTQPFPSCFNPYTRASFIAPVAVGGTLGIAVLITVGLLVYYRNTRQVRQVRECLEMNPLRFVHHAIQYVMMQNRQEENATFRYDMIIFVGDDDRGRIHNHFIKALQGIRSFITRDDFCPGFAEVEAMEECIHVCKWIVPVLTANFISDPICLDFINRVQFSRPHALIPIVWEEQTLEATDMHISISELLRTRNPLYWVGDQADLENERDFWLSFLERATLV